MKLSKLAAGLFAALGTVLLIGSVVLCLIAQGGSDQTVPPPEAAKRCAQEALDAVGSGDLAEVSKYLYGQPSLGMDREPETAEGKQLWDAYRDSICVESVEDCYGKDDEFFQKAVITALDIPGVLKQCRSRAAGLLQQRLEEAEDPAQLLEEDGSVPESLRKEMLAQALAEVLAEKEPTVTREVTLKLVDQDGQWWAVPDKALLEVLSGGLD